MGGSMGGQKGSLFFSNRPNPASFLFIFVLFTGQIQHKYYKRKSIDGVLGTRTRGGMMVGADDCTELWREGEFIASVKNEE